MCHVYPLVYFMYIYCSQHSNDFALWVYDKFPLGDNTVYSIRPLHINSSHIKLLFLSYCYFVSSHPGWLHFVTSTSTSTAHSLTDVDAQGFHVEVLQGVCFPDDLNRWCRANCKICWVGKCSGIEWSFIHAEKRFSKWENVYAAFFF